jgi:hypothetical protein
VDLISKGGNYGWRALEGPLVYHPPWAPGGNTSLDSINAIPPIMGYSHSDVNKNIGSASIMGGYVYRGSADPCLYGRYHHHHHRSLDITISTRHVFIWDFSCIILVYLFMCFLSGTCTLTCTRRPCGPAQRPRRAAGTTPPL